VYSIHAICYTYNNIHIPRYIYMQPYVGIIYYIIFNSWRFLLLTPVLNLISCCCNGFAHCHRHCTVLFTRRGRHHLVTINIYDIRIIHVQLVSRIYIHVHKRIIYMTRVCIYTLCVRPIVSRYNGDVFGHRELNGRRNSRAFQKNIFYKISNKIIIEIHNMIPD